MTLTFPSLVPYGRQQESYRAAGRGWSQGESWEIHHA